MTVAVSVSLAPSTAAGDTTDGTILACPVARPPYGGRPQAVGVSASPAHLLVLDHTLRALVSSLRGLAATHGVYVTDALMPDRERVSPEIDLALRDLVAELSVLSRALVRG